MKFIKSKEHPLIREIKRLIGEKEKKRVFFLEGEKLVKEALSSRVNLKFILITEKFLNENRDFVEKLQKYELIIISEKIEQSLATVETPQGILALAFFEKIGRVPLESDAIVIFLYKIKDPGNLGTIFRSAEAFGVDRIYLSPYSCSPFNTKVIRASTGSCLRVNFFEDVEFDIFRKEIKSKNGKIFTTSPRGGIPPWEIKWDGICSIVIGSEPEGVPEEVICLSDNLISIPQKGGESLNTAISTSIILYEISKRKSIS